MTRTPLLAAAVLLAAAGCASAGTPSPPPNTATATGPESPTAPPPPSSPTGITSREAARIAPLAPARLMAVTETGTIRLTWPATGEDLAYYQCLRRDASGHWLPIGQAPPTRQTYVDRNPGTGTRIYGVRAVNTSGLASPITESRPVTIS